MEAIKFEMCFYFSAFIMLLKKHINCRKIADSLLKLHPFPSYSFFTSLHHVHYTIEVDLIYNTKFLHRCIPVYT